VAPWTRESVEAKQKRNEIARDMPACVGISATIVLVNRTPKDRQGAPLDDVAKGIIEQLQQDGRRSYAEIGEQLGVVTATVRTRVQQMIADEVVEIVGVPDPWKLGVGFFVTVALTLEPGYGDHVADLLSMRDEISYLSVAVSGCDVLAEVSLDDAQEYLRYREEVLGTLPGFRDVRPFLMANVRKVNYRMSSALPRPAGSAPD
jgi:Lrp/AsnC family transcriptional regulator for asnA, asnC and gidA